MKTQLSYAALAAAALLAGCGGGGSGGAEAQPAASKTESPTCYPAASPALIGICIGGSPAPAATTPGSVACRTPDAPAGFKATPPVSPDSECGAAA